MNGLIQDVRYALRRLWKSPVFALVAIVSLALVVLVMREAVRLLAVGISMGASFALLAGRSAGSLLFELKPHDPASLLAAIVLLTGVALLASFLPARRASKVDPMVALRYE